MGCMSETPKPREPEAVDRPAVPPFWEWMAQQHNNSDPARAAAARYIGDRWQFGPWYKHQRVLSALGTEESEHLRAARLLTDDYAELFGLDVAEQLHGFQATGVISPLVPVTADQCQWVYKSNKRCTRDAAPGADKCGWHGGTMITEQERVEIVAQIAARLVDISDRAVATLAHLMDNAKSEKVRHDSAVAILDRIGVGPISKVELDITQSAEFQAAQVRERLGKLRARQTPALPPAAEPESGDIVDAEVVEETAE